MKDVKDLVLVCVWYWCGNNLDWVYSLIHRTLLSHLLLGSYQAFCMTSNSLGNESSCNAVRTNPYADPHHMKMKAVINPVCVWHWCGTNLDWVYSLNHRTLLSFVPGAYCVTSKNLIKESDRKVVTTHPYAHPHNMKAVKDLVCVWHWCGNNLDWVYSLNHCSSLSFIAQSYQAFCVTSNSLGKESSCNAVRTNPYAHPHHMKMKAVINPVCVWHWCGINLDWIYSLNHGTLLLFVPGAYCMTSKNLVKESDRNVVRTHPYAHPHPHHMKFVEDLECVWHWCGNNLDWVYSLNHHTSLSCIAQNYQVFCAISKKLVKDSN